MRIAIPLWNDSVSPVLDTAEHLVVVDIDRETVLSRHEITLAGGGPRENAGIIASHADMLVCGAISRPMYSCLTSLGVDVHPWTMGNVESIIRIFTKGDTPGPEFVMPGCGQKRRGRCGHGGRLRRDGTFAAPFGNNTVTVKKGRE